ncbi:MAG: sigma 54-interacting transcriptional regulator [Acidobacteriota bacterium]
MTAPGNNNIFTKGKRALEESRFEEAANLFQGALRVGVSSLDEDAQIRSFYNETLHKLGRHRKQQEILAKYENPNEFARLSEHTQMLVLIRLGWTYSVLYDIPRAIAYFNQALPIARQYEEDARIGDCFFGLGNSYRFVSEIRIARDHYTSALEHYRRSGNWREIAECYLNVGNIDAREGDFQNAVNPVLQAIAIIGDHKEDNLLGRAYNDLALFYDHLGHSNSEILAAWNKCIDHFRDSGNTLWLGINYNNLAMKLLRLGDIKRAEEYASSAVELIRPTARLSQLGGALDTLAQIYLILGKITEADALLEESIQTFEKIKADKKSLNKEIYLEPQTYTTIGRSFLIKGNLEKAIENLSKAVDIAVRLGDRQYLADTEIWLAEALVRQGKIDKAKETLEVVRKDLQVSPDMVAWGFLSRVDAQIASEQNHFAAAFQSLEQSSSLFEIRENKYQRAINQLIFAQILDKQGDVVNALLEIQKAIAVFEQIGAVIDLQNSKQVYERLLNRKVAPPVKPPKPYGQIELASAFDGFVAQRLVQAAVSRELLLHELTTVIKSLTQSKAVVIFESEIDHDEVKHKPGNYRILSANGLDDTAQKKEVELISKVAEKDFEKNFIYWFSDNQHSNFLLHIVNPQNERFLQGRISLTPLVSIVQQGLETNYLKSHRRKPRVFNASRALAEIELPGFICASRAMNRVIEQIHKIRSSNVTVLITGESGTGKELIARAIHASSSRRTNKFIPFNCSAAPRDLIESQLFGHRKGSFSGAQTENRGIIRNADHGTLFLDEVGDLPIDLQPKLLRFLQEGEILSLGDNEPEIVDVRVVAATNANLEASVAQGRFREDLFHRLNVIRIQMPPLRERREEIPALINYYLKEYQKQSSKSDIQLAEETVDLMVVYDWPGNVRQLCNEIRRIVAYGESNTIIYADSLSPEIVSASRELKDQQSPLISSTANVEPLTPNTTLATAIEELERRMIQEALRRSEGNIAHAAKELGLSRKGLYLKLDRLKSK